MGEKHKPPSAEVREAIIEGLKAGVSESDILDAVMDLGYQYQRDSARRLMTQIARSNGFKTEKQKHDEQSEYWLSLRDEGLSDWDIFGIAQRDGFDKTFGALQKRILTAKKRRDRNYTARKPTITPQARRAKQGSKIFERLIPFYQDKDEVQGSRPVLEFDSQPVCLVFAGDQHLGNTGTDHERLMREAAIVAETEGMYSIQGGDLVDNFIIGRLASMRALSETRVSIAEEWELLEEYLAVFGPKLLAVVGGNHDAWTYKLMGVDYLGKIAQKFMKPCIYDSDELILNLDIDGWVTRIKVRHQWKNASTELNPTNGIEKAYRREGSFDIGVGFHTHVGGFGREFLGHQGRTGLAIQCGAYKRIDKYAKQIGFTPANNSTAMSVIFDPEEQHFYSVGNLETAARIMRMYYA